MFPLMDDSTEEEREIVAVLQEIEGWPTDAVEDVRLVRKLKKLYPTVDMIEEAVKWTIWMSEHKAKKRMKYRMRFANWMRKANEYRAAAVRRQGREHRQAETEGHGESVEARRDW